MRMQTSQSLGLLGAALASVQRCLLSSTLMGAGMFIPERIPPHIHTVQIKFLYPEAKPEAHVSSGLGAL